MQRGRSPTLHAPDPPLAVVSGAKLAFFGYNQTGAVMRHIAIQQVERSASKDENDLPEFESKVQGCYSGNYAQIRGARYHGVVSQLGFWTQ